MSHLPATHRRCGLTRPRASAAPALSAASLLIASDRSTGAAAIGARIEPLYWDKLRRLLDHRSNLLWCLDAIDGDIHSPEQDLLTFKRPSKSTGALAPAPIRPRPDRSGSWRGPGRSPRTAAIPSRRPPSSTIRAIRRRIASRLFHWRKVMRSTRGSNQLAGSKMFHGCPVGDGGPVRRIALADVVYEDRWGQPYRD